MDKLKSKYTGACEVILANFVHGSVPCSVASTQIRDGHPICDEHAAVFDSIKETVDGSS